MSSDGERSTGHRRAGARLVGHAGSGAGRSRRGPQDRRTPADHGGPPQATGSCGRSSAAGGGGHVTVWVPARSSILGRMRTASWPGARLIGRRSAISRPISTETPRRPTSRAHIADSATKVEHEPNRSIHCRQCWTIPPPRHDVLSGMVLRRFDRWVSANVDWAAGAAPQRRWRPHVSTPLRRRRAEPRHHTSANRRLTEPRERRSRHDSTRTRDHRRRRLTQAAASYLEVNMKGLRALGSPAPAPPSPARLPPAPHAAAPLEPQAQLLPVPAAGRPAPARGPASRRGAHLSGPGASRPA